MRRKRPGRSYLGLPWEVVRSQQFGALSGSALKLLMELRAQYRGHNNGDLDATWSRLSRRGWRSKETVHMALRELIYSGWIVRTVKGKKLGGTRYPSLYALTWEAIDDCSKGFPGAIRPSDDWRTPREPFKRPTRVRRKPQAQKSVLTDTDTEPVPIRKANGA